MRARSRVGQEHLGSIRSYLTQSLDEGTRWLLAPDGGTSRSTPLSMTRSSKVVMTLTRSAVFPTPACSGFIVRSLVHFGRIGIRNPCDSPRVSRGREQSGAESDTRVERRDRRGGRAGAARGTGRPRWCSDGLGATEGTRGNVAAQSDCCHIARPLRIAASNHTRKDPVVCSKASLSVSSNRSLAIGATRASSPLAPFSTKIAAQQSV